MEKPTRHNLCMSTGTRVFLRKDGISQVLDSQDTKLARERRQQALQIYSAYKHQGFEIASQKQDEFLQSFEYMKKGPLIFTKVGDSWKPIYAIANRPGRVSGEWFSTQRGAVKRLRSATSVNNALSAFDQFLQSYTPGESATEWFNREVAETRDVLTKQLEKVA